MAFWPCTWDFKKLFTLQHDSAGKPDFQGQTGRLLTMGNIDIPTRFDVPDSPPIKADQVPELEAATAATEVSCSL